jgi:hypothetical protein
VGAFSSEIIISLNDLALERTVSLRSPDSRRLSGQPILAHLPDALTGATGTFYRQRAFHKAPGAELASHL